MKRAELEGATSPAFTALRWLGALLAFGSAGLAWGSAPGYLPLASSALLVLAGFGLGLSSPWRPSVSSEPGETPEVEPHLDAPTQLLSRPAFEERLAFELERSHARQASDALVIIDIRNFHHINDALGHGLGDQLLRQLAERLREALPPSTLLARLSGDVFGVLFRDVTPAQAPATTERLTSIVTPPFTLGDVPIEIEASYGVAVFPEHGQSSALLLQHAETALRLAKEQGKAFSLYLPSDDARDARRLEMFGALRLALEREELVLSYQPKLAFEGDAIVGCEALLSWVHARFGRVSPTEFIPIAEQTSLIGPLTHWVLEHAIRQIALWKREGIHTRVAVNLSARNLSDTTLPSQVAELLRTFGVTAADLIVEITESAVLLDPERAGDVLEQLARMGIALSLDDFGTGYSSLTYLRTVPASELKLDRSFVRDVDTNASNASIIRGITQLAHDLDLRVVAEGVETESEARRVQELGCDVIQGYLISRPISAAAFASFVRSRAARAAGQVLSLAADPTSPLSKRAGGVARSAKPLRNSLLELRSSLHPSSNPSS